MWTLPRLPSRQVGHTNIPVSAHWTPGWSSAVRQRNGAPLGRPDRVRADDWLRGPGSAADAGGPANQFKNSALSTALRGP
jgi:hypothetical protein